MEGSPPLTREELNLSLNSSNVIGITPAYAGRTVIILAWLGDLRDHPRLRGKNLDHTNLKRSVMGSPPLTREEREFECDWLYLEGITPAYAGRTLRINALSTLKQDHPRLRGKNLPFDLHT